MSQSHPLSGRALALASYNSPMDLLVAVIAEGLRAGASGPKYPTALSSPPREQMP